MRTVALWLFAPRHLPRAPGVRRRPSSRPRSPTPIPFSLTGFLRQGEAVRAHDTLDRLRHPLLPHPGQRRPRRHPGPATLRPPARLHHPQGPAPHLPRPRPRLLLGRPHRSSTPCASTSSANTQTPDPRASDPTRCARHALAQSRRTAPLLDRCPSDNRHRPPRLRLGANRYRRAEGGGRRERSRNPFPATSRQAHRDDGSASVTMRIRARGFATAPASHRPQPGDS